MKVEVKHRVPDVEHTTITVGFIDYILSLEEYIKIIKPAARSTNSGAEYIATRNKLLTEYFINGPREQFSW